MFVVAGMWRGGATSGCCVVVVVKSGRKIRRSELAVVFRVRCEKVKLARSDIDKRTSYAVQCEVRGSLTRKSQDPTKTNELVVVLSGR